MRDKAKDLEIQLRDIKGHSDLLEHAHQAQDLDMTMPIIEIEELLSDVKELKSQVRFVQVDTRRLIELTTPELVYANSIRLLSADRLTSKIAKQTLIQLSEDDDPVVRRECLRAFDAIPNYPDRFPHLLKDPWIVARLEAMIGDDQQAIGLEAQRILDKFKSA